MKVPILDPTRRSADLTHRLVSTAAQVISSGKYVLGEYVEEFEAHVSTYLGTPYAVGVSSGTDALLLALMAAGVGPGDEVICPSFTFFATAGAIARVGAKPVFCDIEADSFNLDTTLLPDLITEKTKAIIPVHLFGQPINWEGILAEEVLKHDLVIIEDTAQAFGAEWDTLKAGTLGDYGCYSFFPTKNLGGFGDAGLVVTDSPENYERLKCLRVHGGKQQYVHEEVGGNFRIDALQAAMLKVKLDYTNEYIQQRRFHASYYRDNLSDTLLALPQEVSARGKHSYNQFTVLVQDGQRDALRADLTTHDIATGVYYPLPLHHQQCFANITDGVVLPVTESVCKSCLSLPIAPEIRQDELDYIIDTINSY